MLERKIVRLIIMSNISRRKFLKGAGAAALAVAATGVLAGCSKDDKPVIPNLTKEVKVVFMCDGATVGKDGSVVVDKDATTVPVSMIKAEQLPQGYTVESIGELKIQEIDGKEAVTVTLKKIVTTKEVKVVFVCNGATAGKDGSVVVDKDAKTVPVSLIKAEQLPQGYTVESTGELKIQEIDGKECVLVTLKKIATSKNVTVAFFDTVNNAMLSTTMTITVASDAEFVYKTDLKEALPGYEIIDNGKNQISENNRVVMAVKPVAPEAMRTVTVTYYMQGSNAVITKATVDVPVSKKSLTKAELPGATVESGGYLFDVVPAMNGPFGINYLGEDKGEVVVMASLKMHK